MKELHRIPAAIIAAIFTISLFYGLHSIGFNSSARLSKITVGFICDGDAGTPYSENFLRAEKTLEMTYHERIEIITKTNIPPSEAAEIIDELVKDNCEIIFLNSASFCDSAKEAAQKYPKVEFCQAASSNANSEPVLDNYHTFMGEIYQSWHVCGKVAGLKLTELINSGEIKEDEAVVGFVGAFEVPEIISAYTSFILGVRSECPSAVMRVVYTGAWCNYDLEKECAEKLITEGCVIIAQNTDTIAPAVACEELVDRYNVFHVGYNTNMISIAPSTTLIGARTDWAPYIVSAVEAVLNGQSIESTLKASIHGNDAGGGYQYDWVATTELNRTIAPKDSGDVIADTVERLRNGKLNVFSGNYKGVDPNDPNDTYDLNEPYIECRKSSAPTFHYILNDIITVEK